MTNTVYVSNQVGVIVITDGPMCAKTPNFFPHCGRESVQLHGFSVLMDGHMARYQQVIDDLKAAGATIYDEDAQAFISGSTLPAAPDACFGGKA